jgi:hypothetical protein
MSLTQKQDLLLEATRILDAIRNRDGSIILERVGDTPNTFKVTGEAFEIYTTTVHTKKDDHLISLISSCKSSECEVPQTRTLTGLEVTDMEDTMITIFGKHCVVSVGLLDDKMLGDWKRTDKLSEQLEQSVIY